MQKLMIICLLLTGMGVSSLNAQITDRMVPHSGIMYEIVTQEDLQGSGAVLNRAYYTFNLGSYFMLTHVNDIASVGVDGSVNFGINFPATRDRGTVVTFVAQTPVFLMGRLGANATSYNQQGIGIGAGIGANYTYFNDVADILSGNKVKSNFIVPAAVAEISLKSRGGVLTVRGHLALSTVNSKVSFTNPNFPVTQYKMGNWGIGLISSF